MLKKFAGLALLALSTLAPSVASAGCPCGGGSSGGYSSAASTYLPPASLVGPIGPGPTLAPLYAPPAVVHAPYGPEHIKYSYRYRPSFGTETYRADYPGRNDYMYRQTPTRFGGRVTERYGH